MKKYIKLAVPIVLALAAIYACNKLSTPEIPAVSGNNPMCVSMDEAESMLLEIMDRMEIRWRECPKDNIGTLQHELLRCDQIRR